MLEQIILERHIVENLLNNIKEKAPLIHCITNPISINDCANAVLATGARPIMAEHPEEVAGITSMASVLAVNLGNITDARIKSIMISGKKSSELNIPSIIDIVGVTCSDIRLKLAKKYISQCKPAVIKGNISEIKALSGINSDATGIDVSDSDAFTEENYEKMSYTARIVKELSIRTGAVVVASGKIDTISDGTDVYYIKNGCDMMSRVTGTGCMLNVLIASYMSAAETKNAISDKAKDKLDRNTTSNKLSGNINKENLEMHKSSILQSVIYAVAMLGISGESAAAKTKRNSAGLGSFHMYLLDEISQINAETLTNNSQIYKLL